MRKNFVKNILVLAGGTASAQLINIICLPLLTRLYTPSEFGVFAIFNAINAIVAVFCTWKYENAIIAVETELRAKLSAILVIVLSGITATALLILAVTTITVFNIQWGDIYSLTIASYFAVIIGAWYQAYYFWNNRQLSYSCMSKARLLGALTMVGFATSYGYFVGGVNGLLYGTVLGLCVNLYYLHRNGNALINLKRLPSLKKLVVVAINLKRFPKFLVVSSMLDRTSAQMHLMLFGKFYDTAVSGALGLHNRIISLPTSIIGNAVGDVFKRQASESLRETGQCRRLFFKAALSLFVIASPVAIILMLFAPQIFVFVFGEQWQQAGEISQILSINFWIAFVVSPLSNLIYLEENQKYDFFLQVLLFGMLASSMGYAVVYLDMVMAVWAFSISYIVKYLIEFFICTKIALGHSNLNCTSNC